MLIKLFFQEKKEHIFQFFLVQNSITRIFDEKMF